MDNEIIKKDLASRIAELMDSHKYVSRIVLSESDGHRLVYYCWNLTTHRLGGWKAYRADQEQIRNEKLYKGK